MALDEDDILLYNSYMDYLSNNDSNNSISNSATVAYNYESFNIPQASGILNRGYDESGVWHDWDAEEYGTDSPEYKMLTGLNTAYERANTYGHWAGDKERIADLAAILRVTDTRITDAIVLNNRQGAVNNGHTAVLLLNPHGQGFYFSYAGANGYPNDIGEMRFSILSKEEVNDLKDGSGVVNASVTIYGDRRWDEDNEKDKGAYDRFIWCDVPDMEAGKRMFRYAAEVFSDPGHYNATMWNDGIQCDYVVQQILDAGGIEYEKKLRPNDSFELFRDGKTYWGD